MALQFTGNRNAKMSSVVAIDWDQVVGKPGLVRYDIDQALTDAQKEQARENIGAAPGNWLNVTDYDAVADGIQVDDAAITATVKNLNSESATFSANDVGKLITVTGAGAAGATLATTIAAFVDAHNVTLTDSAGTTVTGATAIYGTDNSAEIQEAVDAIAINGGCLYFPPVANRAYCFNTQITCSVSGTTLRSYVNTGANIHFSSNNRISFQSDGAVLVAMAVMDQMFRFTFDSGLGNGAPLYSEFHGFNVNCNNLAGRGIFHDWNMHGRISRNAFYDPTVTCVDVAGRGVLTIEGNTFRGRASVTIGENNAPNYGGGDSTIIKNDFYTGGASTSYGVVCKGWSGNTVIAYNTFTRDMDAGTAVGVYMNSSVPSDGSKQVNDIRVESNEFRGYDIGVQATRSIATRNLYNLTVKDNHTNFYGIYQGSLVDFNGVDEAIIADNFINFANGADAGAVGIKLADCRRVSVSGNKANNLTLEFMTMIDCLDCEVHGNTLRNIRKGSAAGAVITLAVNSGSTLRNLIANNKVVQGSGTYGQTFVSEGASCDQTFLIDNVLTGISNPPNLVGTSSISREPIAGTVAAGFGYYNSVEHVFKTAGGTQARIADRANAVNRAVLRGAATGNAVVIEPEGSDTDIWMQLAPKGNGLLQLNGETTIPAGKVLRDSVATGLTAAGTNQGTALALTSNINSFGTVGSGTGAILPAKSGAVILVVNRGANSLALYPPVGAAINALSANAAVTVPAGHIARCSCETSTLWLVEYTGLSSDVTANLTVGFTATSYNAGSKTTGTFTPDPALGNHQHYTNGGAHTLAPPSSVCTMILECTNSSAGAITTSGFTIVDGDTYDSSGTKKHIFYITKTNSYSRLTVTYVTGT